MTEKDNKRTSKFLSLVLRHQPQLIGLHLDEHGWAKVDELVEKCSKHGHQLSLQHLQEVVATNDKRRFLFSDDGLMIRASQGHSIEVDLELSPQTPPEYLYHGTVAKFLEPIRKDGLKRMRRQHVHLSKDTETANIVGSRRGEAIILRVLSKEMFDAGFEFFLSDNGVWLTEQVPANFIDFKD